MYTSRIIHSMFDIDDIKICQYLRSGVIYMERNKVFISHRHEDHAVADMIKDFLVNTGVPNDRIFCSSLPGNDVHEKIDTEVKDMLKDSIVIILLFSSAYYDSAYCLNEAGIAWYIDDVHTIPIGLPEIDYKNMIGFIDDNYKLRRLNSDDDVSYIFDTVQEALNLSAVKHSVVTREIKKIKDRYDSYTKDRNAGQITTENKERKDGDNKPKKTSSDNKVTVEIKRDEILLLLYAADDPDGIIYVTKSISRSGPMIETNGYDFAFKDTPRECARWKEAITKLKEYGLIEDESFSGKSFKVTQEGYRIADSLKSKSVIDTNNDPAIYMDGEDFRLESYAAIEGIFRYNSEVIVKPGDVVDVHLEYTNLGFFKQDNVIMKERIPQGLTYIKGSSYLTTSSDRKGRSIADDLLKEEGLELGSFNPGEECKITYRLKVENDETLFPLGDTTVYNDASVETEFGEVRDKSKFIIRRE